MVLWTLEGLVPLALISSFSDKSGCFQVVGAAQDNVQNQITGRKRDSGEVEVQTCLEVFFWEWKSNQNRGSDDLQMQ